MLISLLSLTLTSCALVGASPAKQTPFVNEDKFSCLIFKDDFNKLDSKTWKHDITAGGGGNWEFQYYNNNRSVSFVRDGQLHIRPTLAESTYGQDYYKNGFRLDLWGNDEGFKCTGNAFWGCERMAGAGGNVLPPVESALIRTRNSFSFKYGKVEIRMKLPQGDWKWPAFWMMPVNYEYGKWPASGEIDIVESFGNMKTFGDGKGSHFVSSAMHWGPNFDANRFPMTTNFTENKVSQFSNAFHTFTLEWTQERIFTYLDGDKSKVIMSVPIKKTFWELGGFENSGRDNPWINGGVDAPFDQEFYLMMNVAVGGTGGYWPDNIGNKPWTDKSEHAVQEFWNAREKWLPSWHLGQNAGDMIVDYIKVWSWDKTAKGECKTICAAGTDCN